MKTPSNLEVVIGSVILLFGIGIWWDWYSSTKHQSDMREAAATANEQMLRQKIVGKWRVGVTNSETIRFTDEGVVIKEYQGTAQVMSYTVEIPDRLTLMEPHPVGDEIPAVDATNEIVGMHRQKYPNDHSNPTAITLMYGDQFPYYLTNASGMFADDYYILRHQRNKLRKEGHNFFYPTNSKPMAFKFLSGDELLMMNADGSDGMVLRRVKD